MLWMEFVEFVQEEFFENLVFEDMFEGGDVWEVVLGMVDELFIIDKQIECDDKQFIDFVDKDKKEDIDWECYLENYVFQQLMFMFCCGWDEDMFGVDQIFLVGEDFVDYFVWQLCMGEFMEDEQKFGVFVFVQLDVYGFLKMDGILVEEIVFCFVVEVGLYFEDVEEVFKMMQQFDLVGCCVCLFQESLLIQVESFGMDELVMCVLQDYILDLEKWNYNKIVKVFDVFVEEVYDIVQVIGDFELCLGCNYVSEEFCYIILDVYVYWVGDEYYVVVNDDGMLKFKISGFYCVVMVDDLKAKEYIQIKLCSAQWLIRSIDQRRKTIIKVTECIVEKQRDFFDKGIEFLKPMILRDIAEAVEMHESTISRVTSNKYVHTPRGLFELKFFFNSAIRRDNKEDIASESVKQAIKKIVAAEDPQSPHSDQKIVEILRDRDIRIARRTVAKYREMLGILSSTKRKKYF